MMAISLSQIQALLEDFLRLYNSYGTAAAEGNAKLKRWADSEDALRLGRDWAQHDGAAVCKGCRVMLLKAPRCGGVCKCGDLGDK